MEVAKVYFKTTLQHFIGRYFHMSFGSITAPVTLCGGKICSFVQR
jgi:hypothetical protein